MARKPYVELPDILKLLPPLEAVDTEPDVGGPSGQLTQIENQNINSYILRDGWYDDSSFSPPRLVLHNEPFTIELTDSVSENDEIEWEILQDGQRIVKEPGGLSKTFIISDYVNNSQVQPFEIRAIVTEEIERESGIYYLKDTKPELAFTSIPISDDEEGQVVFTPVYEPFVAKITSVDGDTIGIDSSYQSIVQRIQPLTEGSKLPNEQYTNWVISNKFGDRKDLNTYLHFGDDKKVLTTNVKYDNNAVPTLPYSIVYKTYEPIPDDITEKDLVYVVREVLPPLTETVELVGYAQEDEDFQVLIPKDNLPQDSPITKRQTEFKTYDDLVTTDSRLKDEIEDKFLKETPVQLSVDYSNYENFINFSSAEKRLKNFKYKVQQIEEQKVLSASFVGVTNGQADLKIHHDKIRDIKNNFDGYEKYLY